jgi:hypothetical protein
MKTPKRTIQYFALAFAVVIFAAIFMLSSRPPGSGFSLWAYPGLGEALLQVYPPPGYPPPPDETEAYQHSLQERSSQFTQAAQATKTTYAQIASFTAEALERIPKPPTPMQRVVLQSLLWLTSLITIALTIRFILIPLLLINNGSDMKRINTISWRKILVLLLAASLCSLCGVAATLTDHGFTLPWKEIPAPTALSPGEKPERFLGNSSRYFRIITNEGRAFEVDFYSPEFRDHGIWNWREAPNEAILEEPFNHGCTFHFQPPPLLASLSNPIVDEIGTYGCRRYEWLGESKAVILADGSIWRWSGEKGGAGDVNQDINIKWWQGALVGLPIGVLALFLRKVSDPDSD